MNAFLKLCWLVGLAAQDFAKWNISTTIAWSSMGFGTDFKCPQRINPINFGDSLTFNLALAEL